MKTLILTAKSIVSITFSFVCMTALAIILIIPLSVAKVIIEGKFYNTEVLTHELRSNISRPSLNELAHKGQTTSLNF